MITRTHMAGALRLLNANNTPNRRGWLHNMLKAEHSEADVNKALADLESYPEWGARKDLDPAVSDETVAVAPKRAVKRKK